MTPDHPDQPADDAENGILADTGSIDSAPLGLLGTPTAHVPVQLPSEPEEDDLDEDEVISGEVPFVVEIPADTAEAEIVDDAHDTAPALDAPVEDRPDTEPAADSVGEDVESSPVIEDGGSDVALSRHDDEDIHDAEIVQTGSVAAAPVTASVPVRPSDAPVTGAQPVVPAPAPSTTPAPAMTRAEAHAAAAHDKPRRRSEVALTSKRLGEFEPDRETADLLTADRLLDPSRTTRPEPDGVWQHLIYSLSGRRINLGDGKRARARKELDRRISAPLAGGARFVPVLSRKGGVGKTTITTLLGMALADARDDRIIAVDANPDRGTLAERISRTSNRTVRDLVRSRADVSGYNNLSAIVARDETRLDVLASDTDPHVSEAFSDTDYRQVAELAAHYYSVVLTDTGTGIVHSVMGATLDLADQVVIVAGLSVDEARLASETLTWLETNGYAERVRSAVVVLNNSRPGRPVVQLEELEAHFRSRVRSVVRMPYDPLIAAGSAITFRDLQPETRQAAREMAATVVEGLRSLASAA
ncbi:MinD/ParA family ATP-binding protein [Microbacterium aurantiacum]|uniref:AAA family ATPase n=1 Tax=Microbacterium aurantiacum TaxID=162393 RepID=A0AAJ2M022_9MICO|nr:AAA family ATPase [Microbacterium aurantiacum]MDS0245919.1 AAA family ATPase [Microbacterium aurantiacum]